MRKVNFFCVQVHVNSLARSKLLAPLSPTCISASPTGDKPWYLHRGIFATIYIQPFTWGNQRGELPLYIRHPPGCLAAPLGAPLRLYLALRVETPKINLLLSN